VASLRVWLSLRVAHAPGDVLLGIVWMDAIAYVVFIKCLIFECKMLQSCKAALALLWPKTKTKANNKLSKPKVYFSLGAVHKLCHLF
jgi:hypothetical protein